MVYLMFDDVTLIIFGESCRLMHIFKGQWKHFDIYCFVCDDILFAFNTSDRDQYEEFYILLNW